MFIFINNDVNGEYPTIKTIHFDKPIVISPSAIKLYNSNQKLYNNQILNYSPNILNLSPPLNNIKQSPGTYSNLSSIKNEIPFIAKPPEKKYVFRPDDRCFKSKGELLTCKVFEEFLKRKVHVNVRPNWFRNPKTGHKLEFDLYDPKSKIAIEYDGKQHFEYCPYFHKSEKDFYCQLERDNFKNEKCLELGIKLIRIPYFVDVGKQGKNGNWYTITCTDKEREDKIKDYLLPLLE